MGLGLGLKPRTSTIQLQIQMEKLYMSILDSKQPGDMTIVNNEHLKPKLKCFGIKHQPTDHFDPLTREQKSALRKLRLNDSIVVQRPDKGGGVAVMNKLDYNNKLLDLVNYVSKFKLCDCKQSDRVKVKINKIASDLRTLHPSHFFIKFDVRGTTTTDICTGSPKCTKTYTTPH